MKQYILITILFFAVSCNKKEKEKLTQKPQYNISSEIQILVDSLSLIKYVSYGEKQTPRYDSLVKKASINDLVFLTDYKVPYIRCFSFLALVEKNYPKVQDIFNQHKNDTSLVVTGMYDMITNETVASYMLQKLHPHSKSKYKFKMSEFQKLYNYIEERDRKLKSIPEEKINWPDSIKKKQHLDIQYTQEYYWSDSDDKDFELKRKMIKKTVPFQKFDNSILVTAYFEVNGCHPHFPNMERKGDTIILRNQILHKNPCDRKFKVIDKINFMIADHYITNIKTVIVE